jgi:hypothetical protein
MDALAGEIATSQDNKIVILSSLQQVWQVIKLSFIAMILSYVLTLGSGAINTGIIMTCIYMYYRQLMVFYVSLRTSDLLNNKYRSSVAEAYEETMQLKHIITRKITGYVS